MYQPVLSADETATRLPYGALAQEIALLLQDTSVQVPTRLVQALPGGGSLFVMPALDSRIAITKLITFTLANAGTARATIQGDVVVFDVASGRRLFILDGPTVTARRTAAVSLLAAQLLAPNPTGALLIVGAGAQGRAHLDAFVQGLGVRQVFIASGSIASASALAEYAESVGVRACVISNPNTVLDNCPLVVTCTPANQIVIDSTPRPDAFIAAVGAFTPTMAEIGRNACRHIAAFGTIVLDTADAIHEAGDIFQAGLDPGGFKTLGDVIGSKSKPELGPVLLKSCGWAGWDLAAARTILSAGVID